MNRFACFAASLFAVSLLAGGCASTPDTEQEKEALHGSAESALTQMTQKDPSLKNVIDKAYGYAIFPDVGKAGAIVGGASGVGEVYEQGKFIGRARLTQGSVGATLGAQTFRELIVFQNKNALQKFKNNEFSFGANASAIAIKQGAGATANFADGVAVFTMPVGGAMIDLSLSGQQFTFTPAEGEAISTTRPAR